MDEALARVRKAYRAKRKAEEEVRAAVLAARDKGISQPKIAEAAGVSQPSILELERRARGAKH